jgi:hypothetical protein
MLTSAAGQDKKINVMASMKIHHQEFKSRHVVPALSCLQVSDVMMRRMWIA